MQQVRKLAVVVGLALLPAVAQGGWSSVSAGSGAVYKCVESGHVTYQAGPCPAGATQTLPGRAKQNQEQREAVEARSMPRQEVPLARFRLSEETPFLPKNDGKLETAFNAPSLQPGEVVFIVGAEGSGNDAWYRAFRVQNGKRDYGFIYSPALLGQDESLPLNDWVHALKKPSQVRRAEKQTNGFRVLPSHDIDEYCDGWTIKIAAQADIDKKKFRESCLNSERSSEADMSSRFQQLPFIIRKTCAIESPRSYESLKTCVDLKQDFYGDALTFPR